MITYGTYATPRADLGEAFHEFVPEGMTLIADRIFPSYPVQTEDGTISVITRENMRADETERAEGGTFRRIDIEGEDLSYTTKNHGLEIPVTDRERRKYTNDFQIETEKTQIMKLRMKLRRELRVSQAIFNTTTWTGDLQTDYSGAPWDAAGSDVITHVRTAMRAVKSRTGVKPNALVIGDATAENLCSNTGIIARFPDNVTLTVDLIRERMAAIFGLQHLIVGDAVYNSADQGQAFSGADIWADDYAWIGRVAEGEGSPVLTPAVGRTLRWADMAGNPDTVDQYREEQTKSDILRVEDYLEEKVFDAYFGQLLIVDE